MKKAKKKFKLPTQADAKGEIGVRTGSSSNQPFTRTEEITGDSVDAHREIEVANEDIAKDEIMQVYNNS
ncbi:MULTISPECIES: hypothetical protein [Bacillaceae]|uniref:hypothetical protein n=1 Tax=Bacillaceae TaxID=186817 RepID=UPI0006D24C1F|nr:MULTISPECIES: hypothetical protein [Bacillaceae]